MTSETEDFRKIGESIITFHNRYCNDYLYYNRNFNNIHSRIFKYEYYRTKIIRFY